VVAILRIYSPDPELCAAPVEPNPPRDTPGDDAGLL